jgi:uncharacterized protein
VPVRTGRLWQATRRASPIEISKLEIRLAAGAAVTRRRLRIGHCYRCLHSWRMRKQYPQMCPRCKSRLWKIPKTRPVTFGNGLGLREIVTPHRVELLRLARQFGARNLRVFGSVARNEATAQSDVDFLVAWRRPHSLLDRIQLQQAFEEVLGRSVDLANEGGLHWALAPQIESEAVSL